MLLIRNTLNWSIRVILAVILVWGILPYIPKNYADNDIPDNRFPVLIANSENKPEVLRFEEWIKISPTPILWTVAGNGEALMGSIVFAYSVALSPSGSGSPYRNSTDNVVITMKRDSPDHIVSATYNINNNKFSAVRYHSMDPGIAFVFILWLLTWGFLAFIRRLIFAILNRFTNLNHSTNHNRSIKLNRLEK